MKECVDAASHMGGEMHSVSTLPGEGQMWGPKRGELELFVDAEKREEFLGMLEGVLQSEAIKCWYFCSPFAVEACAMFESKIFFFYLYFLIIFFSVYRYGGIFYPSPSGVASSWDLARGIFFGASGQFLLPNRPGEEFHKFLGYKSSTFGLGANMIPIKMFNMYVKSDEQKSTPGKRV